MQLSKSEQKKYERWKREKQIDLLFHDREKYKYYDEEKVYQLFRMEMIRREEQWYASFEDVYGKLMQEFSGQEPEEELSFEDRFYDANKLFCVNCRVAVSKVMQLARDGYHPAMVKASDMLLFNEFLHENTKRSLYYAKTAIDEGFEGAYAMYAIAYFGAHGFNPENRKFKELVNKAIKSNHPWNYRYLGLIFLSTSMGYTDFEEAERYFDLAIQNEDLAAAVNYCYLLAEPKIHSVQAILNELMAMQFPPALFICALHKLDIVREEENSPDEEEKLIKDAILFLNKAASMNYLAAQVYLFQNNELKKKDGSLYRLTDYKF